MGDAEERGSAEQPGEGGLVALVQQLEQALASRVKDVVKREEQVTAASKSLDDEKKAMTVLGSQLDGEENYRTTDLIRLNVGGQIFTTRRSTLMHCDGSVLEGMFSGRWDRSFDLDEEGRIFLDLDAECFAEVLHHLRLAQLTGQSEIQWGKVSPPERREVYFRLMLDFLGLAKLPAFMPTFAFVHPGISKNEGDSCVVSCSEGHRWAIGETVMEAGTYMWGFKIHSLKSNYWIFLGVIASSRPADESFSDPTSWGWACSTKGCCFMRGQSGVRQSPAAGCGGWTGFEEGDDVTMQLNADSGVLRMKVARLQHTVFHFTGLAVTGLMHAPPWRIHVNLYNVGDRVELISAGQF